MFDPATFISTARKSRLMPDERWLNGPRAFAGEPKSYTHSLSDYLAWVAEVEGSLRNLEACTQRLRLLYYGEPAGSSQFDWLISTKMAPLTTADAPRATLESLMRTGYVDTTPSGGVRRPRLDLSHVLAGADLAINGVSGPGWALRQSFIEPAALLSWSGDLASWWTAYNDIRLEERARVLAAGGSWTEPATPPDLARPRGWLDSRRATARCPAEDLLGDMDAVILAGELRAGTTFTPLTNLLRRYYEGNSPAFRWVDVANRFHLFVRRAVPRIDHSVGADEAVTLGPNAYTDIAKAVETTAAALLIFARFRAMKRTRRLPSTTVYGDISSPWGHEMLAEIATRFHNFLRNGLATDAWNLAGWSTVPLALDEYGGFVLQIGDSDDENRHGGEVHSPGPRHVEKMQQRLMELGFTAIGGSTGDFGERTAVAVREFQIAASQQQVWADRHAPAAGRFRNEPFRRYLGPIHGVLDEETAAAIGLWRNPRGDPDPARANSGMAGIGKFLNPVEIQSRARVVGPGAAPGPLQRADVWRHDEETDTGRRLWALDHLERYDIPSMEPGGGETPPLACVGRFVATPAGGGGPVSVDDDLWESASIELADLLAEGKSATRRDQSDFRVVRAVAQAECQGHFDSVNASGGGRLELGAYHWALRPLGTGELAAFLARYKQTNPLAYHQDFGRYGIEPSEWKVDDQATLQSRIALFGLRDTAGKVHPFTARPLGALVPGSQPPTLIDDYLVDWLRSWRGMHRVVMALRLSRPLQQAQWTFAVERITRLLEHTLGVPGAVVFSFPTPGIQPACFGDVFTSEKSVALLLRWHVNRPDRILDANGAVADALATYLAVYGPGDVNLSTRAQKDADQRNLVEQLVNRAPATAGFKRTVEIVRDYNDAQHGALGDSHGSYR